MEHRLISGGTIAELYAYLQNNGGSYNDLRVRFQHNDIRPHKDVEHSSTRNRDVFLDEYIQPLQLTDLGDVEKLIKFIEQVVGSPDAPNSVNPEAEKLLESLRQDGWQVEGNKIIGLGSIPHISERETVTMPSNIEKRLLVLIKGLPRAMYPLKNRRKGMLCLHFDNEYDVQDLLHALLRPWIRDIRPEEYTPSFAGSSARIDFVLAKHDVVIEVKYVRNQTHAKRVGEELISDIAHYKVHPQCKQLWIVVYDPGQLISNPDGLASDLEKQAESLRVRTFVLPYPHSTVGGDD